MYFADGPRPTPEQVIELRGHMLKYVKQLILKGQGIHEDELQSILNYLTTVQEVQDYYCILVIIILYTSYSTIVY